MTTIVLAVAVMLLLQLIVNVLLTLHVSRQAARRVPPTGNFVDIDGTRLHYLDRGTGPAVVMVHGLGGNLLNFRELTERLSDSCRVIAVDRPGAGYSTTITSRHPGLHDQAALIAGLINKLGLQRPVIVGHSLGGAVALAMALDHPQRVGPLVLLAPYCRPPREPRHLHPALRGYGVRARWLQWLYAWMVVVPLGKLVEAVALRAAFSPEPVPAGFQVDGGGMLAYRPPHYMAACRDATVMPAEVEAMVPQYASLSLPIDVVFGRHDAVLDPAHQGHALVSAALAAHLHLVDGGHMIPVTEAASMASLVRRAAGAA